MRQKFTIGVMTFGGLHFNHRFAAQHAILDTADFVFPTTPRLSSR
ncbi:Uncharacterised protein [Klebsiella pneumoniae]|uniref:Uncharacterized protein n=1 Tax=Klebsiella pneumoniae TaxID=573 RepID=A0A377U1F2_KLEPN|nr:Uncharacterised protein [Klebsiella pneumoniae]